MSTYQWESLAPDDLDNGSRLPEIKQLVDNHPDTCLDHDPVWLMAKAEAFHASIQIFLCYGADGELVGYAPFYVHNSQLAFSYAGRSLAQISIHRYAITAQPLMRSDDSDSAQALLTLMQLLRGRLASGEVLFALGTHLESAFGQSLAFKDRRQGFLLMPHGPSYQRRRARVYGLLDDYLAVLGSKTRQDLRRQERRFLKQADDDIEVSVYSDAASVGVFLSEVEQLSRLTYQWNLLGIGVSNNKSMSALLRASAEKGWLRGYILKARRQPVAFMIGYLYAGTYYSEQIGYHPGWRKWSVGNVLHLHVMRDLARLDVPVQWFDFMYGDNSNKERLSTDSHVEQNFYLIPDTLRWRLVVPALRGFDHATNALSQALDRYGLKEKIRRMMRLRSVQTSEKGSSDA